MWRESYLPFGDLSPAFLLNRKRLNAPTLPQELIGAGAQRPCSVTRAETPPCQSDFLLNENECPSRKLNACQKNPDEFTILNCLS